MKIFTQDDNRVAIGKIEQRNQIRYDLFIK